MCHVSRVTCHVSCVTCHMSHVTCHLSQKKQKKNGKSGEISRSRVCYQRGLPRLVLQTLPLLLEYFQNYISLYCCSLIQGQGFLVLLTFYGAIITECYISGAADHYQHVLLQNKSINVWRWNLQWQKAGDPIIQSAHLF